MRTPRIKPETWNASAGLMANNIDTKRARGVRHPHAHDHDLLLGVIRNEYDTFAGVYYGAEIYEEVGANWFAAMAIMCLDMTTFYADDTFEEPLSASSLIPFLTQKQLDYGYENINRFGTDGLLVRMHDKIARLENLVANRSKVSINDLEINFESIEDTLADLIGYCIIGCMVVRDIWKLPMNDKYVHVKA